MLRFAIGRWPSMSKVNRFLGALLTLWASLTCAEAREPVNSTAAATALHWFSYYIHYIPAPSGPQRGAVLKPPTEPPPEPQGLRLYPLEKPPTAIVAAYLAGNLAPGMDSVIQAEFRKILDAAPGSEVRNADWTLDIKDCSVGAPVAMASASYQRGSRKGTVCLSPYIVKAIFVYNGGLDLEPLKNLYVTLQVDPLTYDGEWRRNFENWYGVSQDQWAAMAAAGANCYTNFVVGIDYAIAREVTRATMSMGTIPTESGLESALQSAFPAFTRRDNVLVMKTALKNIAAEYTSSGRWGFESPDDADTILGSMTVPNE